MRLLICSGLPQPAVSAPQARCEERTIGRADFSTFSSLAAAGAAPATTAWAMAPCGCDGASARPGAAGRRGERRWGRLFSSPALACFMTMRAGLAAFTRRAPTTLRGQRAEQSAALPGGASDTQGRGDRVVPAGGQGRHGRGAHAARSAGGDGRLQGGAHGERLLHCEGLRTPSLGALRALLASANWHGSGDRWQQPAPLRFFEVVCVMELAPAGMEVSLSVPTLRLGETAYVYSSCSAQRTSRRGRRRRIKNSILVQKFPLKKGSTSRWRRVSASSGTAFHSKMEESERKP